jgi:hypothetical protein
MEPLSPEDKRRLLQERKDVTAEDIAEYERLLAEYFSKEPVDPVYASGRVGGTDPLTRLHRKLFGDSVSDATNQSEK